MLRVGKTLYDYFFMPLVLSKNPPWFDARGVSLGFVAGFIMPIGGQLLLIGILRMLLRFNTLLAISFSFISNPFTIIPLYRGYYGIGSLFMGESGSLDKQQFDTIIGSIVNHTYAWNSIAAFSDLGMDILVRWFLGAVVLAAIFGTAGYLVTFFFQSKRSIKSTIECEEDTVAS